MKDQRVVLKRGALGALLQSLDYTMGLIVSKTCRFHSYGRTRHQFILKTALSEDHIHFLVPKTKLCFV